ncbi:hypothetical protein DER46DRAFT_573625 [Fusarium sp. MPI-SDFR-AT-0072]|nr:hypothetical protein DER46DRAFT_573625 [Fusarium sp. MPI-SDFR-AT-0072]
MRAYAAPQLFFLPWFPTIVTGLAVVSPAVRYSVCDGSYDLVRQIPSRSRHVVPGGPACALEHPRKHANPSACDTPMVSAYVRPSVGSKERKVIAIGSYVPCACQDSVHLVAHHDSHDDSGIAHQILSVSSLQVQKRNSMQLLDKECCKLGSVLERGQRHCGATVNARLNREHIPKYIRPHLKRANF